jgi:hypothetical protein
MVDTAVESSDTPDTTDAEKARPIEAWLTRDVDDTEIARRIVDSDETFRGGALAYAVNSLSMRGAQREITAVLIADGFKPAGRWQSEFEDGSQECREASRQFRKD